MTISENEERSMSDDVDNLFDEKEQPEVEEKPEKEAPEPEAKQPEGERAETPAMGEDEGAPPAPTDEEHERNIPYGALKDERTKRQAAERELQRLREWQQHVERHQREARLRSIEDPDERIAEVQSAYQQDVLTTRLQMSKQYAERQHGNDFVNEVVDFFNDPQHAPMSHQFLRTADPFGAAVEYYNAQKALREIGPDPKAYEAQLRERLKAEIMAELSPAKPKAPPRSMASAPSAGGNSNPPGSGFDALFGAKD